MRIYISLPISGKDLATQQQKALEVAEKLRELGHEPVSPLPPPEAPSGLSEKELYAFYMGEDVKKLLTCDAVYFCKGYLESKGCIAEMHIAMTYGLRQFYCNPIEDIPKNG